MNKYVRLDIKASGVKFFNTNYLYGLPSPLVYHSFLVNLREKTGLNILPGFTLTYKEVYDSKVSNYQLSSRGPRDPTGIVDNPKGGIFVSLVFQINDDRETKLILKDLNYINKMKLAGGFIYHFDIKIHTDISRVKPYGFTQYSNNEAKDIFDLVVVDSLSLTKGLSSLAVVGKIKLCDADYIFTKYNKKTYFDEGIVKKTSFCYVRDFSEEAFENYKWMTFEDEEKIIIKTKKEEI